MDYLESFQQALQHATAAVAFLRKVEQPPHPRNFELLYGHFSRKCPALSRELEEMLKTGEPISVSALSSLYDRHFGHDLEAQAIRDASETIQAALSNVLSRMSEAASSSQAYGRALQDFSGHIDDSRKNGATGIDELRTAVTTILAETRRMQENTRRLESQFAVANSELIELKQNLDEWRQEALTDGLTGIANRKAFDGRALEHMKDMDRQPLCLLMIDIDHFKAFNDTYGHQVGDQVLRLVARTLVDCVRGQDFAARYGGEEFVILLPNTEFDGAFAVAENIRKTVAAKKITRKSTGETLGQITLSLGIALYRPGEDLEQFLRRADEGLYLAKSNGRNRTSAVESIKDMAASA